MKTVDEITLRYEPKDIERETITSPRDAARFLRLVWNEQMQIKESFYVVLLDNKKEVTGYTMISLGGTTATIVDPAEVLRVAIRSKCSSMILAHNHPSGNLEASRADKQLTDRIVKLGKLLGVPVNDHLIMTGDSHISLRAAGVIG